jgi:hypothetical protein
MPTPREIMETEVAEALRKAEEIRRDMRELERIVAKYHFVVVPAPSEPPPNVDSTLRYTYTKAAHEAEAIIRAAGHPMTVGDLVHVLMHERGRQLDGKNQTNLLGSALSGNRNVYYMREVGWWITGVPWPPTADDIAKLQAGGPVPVAVQTVPEGTLKGKPRRSPQKQILFEAIRSVLKDSPEPVNFSVLLEMVKETGAVIGGTNERQNFASFLAKFPCFKSEGRKAGWHYIPERDYELLDSSDNQRPKFNEDTPI